MWPIWIVIPSRHLQYQGINAEGRTERRVPSQSWVPQAGRLLPVSTSKRRVQDFLKVWGKEEHQTFKNKREQEKQWLQQNFGSWKARKLVITEFIGERKPKPSPAVQEVWNKVGTQPELQKGPGMVGTMHWRRRGPTPSDLHITLLIVDPWWGLAFCDLFALLSQDSYGLETPIRWKALNTAE